MKRNSLDHQDRRRDHHNHHHPHQSTQLSSTQPQFNKNHKHAVTQTKQKIEFKPHKRQITSPLQFPAC
jgi:hypothetical protein